jgi:hypothetical protein
MYGPRSWEAVRELPAVVMRVTPGTRGGGTRWDRDTPHPAGASGRYTSKLTGAEAAGTIL